VHVRCAHDGAGRVAFEVTDTGPGIPEELLPRLFEPFDRLGAESSAVEGTGIGLALADALARAMDGHIEVSTELGVGSTFRLLLRAAADAPVLAFAEVTGPDLDLGAAAVRILYIEDNATNAMLMARVVALRPGCRLEVVTTGDEGLRSAGQAPPDLAFLDLHLPDLSGEEVLRRMRALPGCGAIPIVVVTADASPGARERMMALGSDGFLTKPIDLDDVLGWIDRAQPVVGSR
jgi:CheY-like chemotaxis protein